LSLEAALIAGKGFLYSLGTALVIFLAVNLYSSWGLSLAAGIASTLSGMMLGEVFAYWISSFFKAMPGEYAMQLGYVLAAACGPFFIVGFYKLASKVSERFNRYAVELFDQRIKTWLKGKKK